MRTTRARAAAQSKSGARPTGARRDRGRATQSEPAPAPRAARACSSRSLTGLRPSKATPRSDKAAHRIQDLDVAGAAAEVAAQVVTDLGLGRRGALGQERLDRE